MDSRPHRILVVDDEPGIREGCRKILVAEGFEVETADNGTTGYEMFKGHRNFSAALIDLKMPGISGLELIELIRREDDDLVIFVITAHATIETAVESTKRGAYNYLPKPFTPEELLIALRNGLEKRRLSLDSKILKVEQEKQLLELSFERSKSKSILNCISDGVIVINRQGQIVLRNSAAARIIPEFSGCTLPVRMEEVIRSPEIKELFLETCQAEGDNVIRTREIPLDKGAYMVNATPVYNPDRENLGVVTVLRDITALKKLNVTKARFVSMVAEQVKGPLATIEDCLRKIAQPPEPGSASNGRGEAVGDALVRMNSLNRMLDELISLSDIETGRFAMKRYPVEISEILINALRQTEDKAKDKNIAISLHHPEGNTGGQVLADKAAMTVVFENLIDNAINYTPPGGRVDLSIEDGEIFLTVSVGDNGIGMSDEEIDRIFDDFYRAKNDYTVHMPGTGLGLSLVKRLVDIHQGRVSVKSRLGEGSVFKVNLPKV
ncbi:MAG: response regulator [Smithellaceae bacterium]|nr:response regulator [Smithellaceae bacterium]